MSTLDRQIRNELNEEGERWLTWTQLAQAHVAVLDLLDRCETDQHQGFAANSAIREAIGSALGITQEAPHGG